MTRTLPFRRNNPNLCCVCWQLVSFSPSSLIGHWSKIQSKQRDFGQEDSRKTSFQKSSRISFSILMIFRLILSKLFLGIELSIPQSCLVPSSVGRGNVLPAVHIQKFHCIKVFSGYTASSSTVMGNAKSFEQH